MKANRNAVESMMQNESVVAKSPPRGPVYAPKTAGWMYCV